MFHDKVFSAYRKELFGTMRTTRRLYARGKITVPATIREELDLNDGDLVEIDVRPVEGGAGNG